MVRGEERDGGGGIPQFHCRCFGKGGGTGAGAIFQPSARREATRKWCLEGLKEPCKVTLIFHTGSWWPHNSHCPIGS